MANQGRRNEDEMVFFLNNRKVGELSNNLKEVVKELYGIVDPEVVLKCYLAEDFIKPDIVINYDGFEKGISIKCFNAALVHGEKLDTFIDYLIGLGVSDETINTILLHQFGDGTTDGTGEKRMTFAELAMWLDEPIKRANEELNQKQFLLPIMERLLFQGVNENARKADAIYVGNYENGLCTKRRQFIKYFERKDFDFLRALHIGPITFRPHARYIGTKIVDPESRFRIDFYWYSLIADMEYINKKYDSYTPMRYRKFDE